MTVEEIAARIGEPVCTGGCGLSARRHRDGIIDPFGIVHFGERKFSRRSLRNLLLLVARARREADPEYLNIDLYDWLYLYLDSVTAANLARTLGVVIPARLWDDRRALCLNLARQRGVRLGAIRNRRVYQWVNPR